MMFDGYICIHFLHVYIVCLIEAWLFDSRPRTVDDVAYQDEVVAVLKKSLQGSDVSEVNY